MQEQFKVESLNFALPEKVQNLLDLESLQQVRITYDRSLKQWYLIIIYNKDSRELPGGYDNIMSIDLGSANLAAISFLHHENSYLISGRPLRSMISHSNQQIARLQGIAMSMHGSKKHKNTKAINKLYSHRNNYTKDYLHKVSRRIVDKAYENSCNTIVIGDIKDIKQSMDYNKLFVQLPLRMLRDMIIYKARLLGIQVETVSEAYTSGCSALDMESLNRMSYNKSRRMKRGQFRSEKGIMINADINGSLNILRRYIAAKDIKQCIPRLITSARDKGCVDNPVKLRVA
jgi:IS605 OrfB family transposase